MTGITADNVNVTVLPVFVFGLLQMMSFAALFAVSKRNCGIRTVHQLAFVLETQMPLVQDKLIFWTIMTLCFRVAHFGVDFTFKFDKV
ncbi:hypothetical protein KRP22_006192 [Phytophthora ramorum]|nr:hypothetical protein KRP22_2675 [Phytophthora ramorum]